jgi:hypothetical protein
MFGSSCRLGLRVLAACTGLAILGRAEAAVDFQLFERVLVQNVRNGYVDYEGIRADPAFLQFIGELAAKPAAAETDPKAQLALLINAYNAFAIKGILDGHSPASLLARRRYFKGVKYQLLGEAITLEELEGRRIRPLGDPRIHFAIVCASISCPRLSNHAYLPETLDEQLDDAVRRFVNDLSRNRFDVAQRMAFVSRIFEWFADDFGKPPGAVPAFMARYATDGAVRAALEDGRLQFRYLDYDWDLNGRVGPGDR